MALLLIEGGIAGQNLLQIVGRSIDRPGLPWTISTNFSHWEVIFARVNTGADPGWMLQTSWAVKCRLVSGEWWEERRFSLTSYTLSRSVDMGGQVLDLRICTRFSSCLKHLSLQVSITSSLWWRIEVKMDIKQTASRDLWPIWPSHKIISDISTNQEIFIFSYFYCQGFKTESCPSKSFPLLPLPHLARPQVFFLKNCLDLR